MPPPIATDEPPNASLCAPMATVATLPFALVVWSKAPGILGPRTVPSVGLNAVPTVPELLKPALLPGASTACTFCIPPVIANAAKTDATTIFFLPVVFLAISDTTT